MPKRILIVSFKVGMGHVKAAQAICEAFCDTDVEVKHIDLSDYCTVASKKFYLQGYQRIVTHVPALYSFFYHRLPSSSARLRAFFDSINATKLRKYILDFEPDLIVSTHFIPTSLLSRWKKAEKLNYKIAFVGTDFAAHRLWIDKNVDWYFSPTEDVKKELIELGAKGEIFVSGIPIGRNFTKKFDKMLVRKELGLDNKFTVLLMNGGFGVGKGREILKNLAGYDWSIQVIAIAGANSKLKMSYEKIALNSNNVAIKVFGFTDKIPELMAASDLIVSKAGGLTVAESLAAGTPMLAFEPTPGQEEANVNYLERNNAILSADSIPDIETNIRYILDGVINLPKIQKNARNIAMPGAARDIGEKIVQILS